MVPTDETKLTGMISLVNKHARHELQLELIEAGLQLSKIVEQMRDEAGFSYDIVLRVEAHETGTV